jgi:ribosomal protein L40E
MSEAPLAPTCRHCGATNDSGASECWLCQRRDWREAPKHRPGRRPRNDARPTFVGCLIVVTIAVIMMVGWAFRLGRIVGLAVLVLAALVYAVAIALFLLCLAVSRI